MSELSHYIKLRSSLSGCNAKQFECDKYLDCDSCLEDKIKEHDKQIRADAIDEFVKKIKESNQGHWRPTRYEHGEVVSETMSYDIGTIRLIAEQLKAGGKNEN